MFDQSAPAQLLWWRNKEEIVVKEHPFAGFISLFLRSTMKGRNCMCELGDYECEIVGRVNKERIARNFRLSAYGENEIDLVSNYVNQTSLSDIYNGRSFSLVWRLA